MRYHPGHLCTRRLTHVWQLVRDQLCHVSGSARSEDGRPHPDQNNEPRDGTAFDCLHCRLLVLLALDYLTPFLLLIERSGYQRAFESPRLASSTVLCRSRRSLESVQRPILWRARMEASGVRALHSLELDHHLTVDCYSPDVKLALKHYERVMGTHTNHDQGLPGKCFHRSSICSRTVLTAPVPDSARGRTAPASSRSAAHQCQ